MTWPNVLGKPLHAGSIPFLSRLLVLESGKVLFILLQLWSASSGFTRFSLLCFYYRLVQHINWRRSTIVLHVVVVINVIFSVGNMLALCLACRPLNVLWSGELHPKCINLSNFLFSMAVATTVLEFIVAMLPVPVILTLQMDRKQKWSVAALLCMGLFTTLAGCIRNYYVWKGWFSSYDAFWTADPIWLSAEIENWVAIVSLCLTYLYLLLIRMIKVCACAPALRPVLGRLIGQRPITTKDSTLRSDVQPFNDSFSQDDFQKSYREAYGNQQVWFDLEGIRTDHLGYSVKITGGNHSPDRQSIKRRRWLGAGCNFGGAPKCQRRVLLRQKSPQKECFSPDSSQTSKLSKTSETNKIGGIRVEVRRSTEINREEPDQSEYDEITC